VRTQRVDPAISPRRLQRRSALLEEGPVIQHTDDPPKQGSHVLSLANRVDATPKDRLDAPRILGPSLFDLRWRRLRRPRRVSGSPQSASAFAPSVSNPSIDCSSRSMRNGLLK
jgi:hypothetical protein